MRYKGVCKSCGYKFAESDSAMIADMPMACPLCRGDMAVIPVRHEVLKDYSYEVVIQCKENGANVINGFIMTADELSKEDNIKNGLLAKRICEVIAKVVVNPINMNNLTKQ